MDCDVSVVDVDTVISSLDPEVADFGKVVDRSLGSNSDWAAELLSMSLDEYTFIALYMIKSSPRANIRPRRVLRRISADLLEATKKPKAKPNSIKQFQFINRYNQRTLVMCEMKMCSVVCLKSHTKIKMRCARSLGD